MNRGRGMPAAVSRSAVAAAASVVAFAVTCLLASVAPPASAAAPAAPASYRAAKPVERQLKNQLKLYVIEDRRLPMVYYRFVFRAGSSHEPAEKAGLAALTLETMTQGTAKRDAKAFNEAIDALGGQVGANATRDYMAITGQFLSRDWRQGLDLLAEMIRTPAFSRSEFERTRSQVEAALTASRDDNATVASEHASALVYGAHPYGRPSGGEPGSVAAITREDLVRFHATYVRPNLGLLVVVGDVDAEQVRSDLEAHFRDWEPAEPPARPGPPLPVREANQVRILDKPEQTQAELRIGHEGVPRSAPDFYAIQVMNSILGGGGFSSRLTQAVRGEGGLTYDISTGYDMGLDKGAFFVSTFTKNASVGPTVDLILRTIRDFQASGPTAKELADAKQFLAGSLPLRLQSAESVAAQWAAIDLYNLGTDFFDRYADRLRLVTAEDVKKAAQEHLRTDKLVVVAVGSADSVRAGLTPFGEPEVLDYRSPTGAIPQAKPTQAVPAEVLSPESVARAKEVVARAVRAHGGQARLLAHKDMSIRSTVSVVTPNGSVEGEMAMTIQMPSRTRIEMNMLGQRGVQVLDGERAWATAGGQVQDLNEEQTQAMRAGLKIQVLPLLARLAKEEVQVGWLDRDVVGTDSVDVLQVVDPDAMARVSVSRASGLIVRLEQEEPSMFGGGRVPMSRLYSDHRPVDGYVLPYRTERYARGERIIEDRVTDLRVNRGTTATQFVRPAR